MNIKTSVEKRVEWIKGVLAASGAKGIAYGNSGGKDCTLVAALAKRATDNVVGVIMPCESSRNYGEDREDALAAGKMYGIEQLEIDLTPAKTALVSALGDALTAEGVPEWARRSALININPRLRMTAVYAVAQARGYLVAGTGNACEYAMGYFTKWGDGAYDFNPIADLTVEEVYEHLRYLGSPAHIIEKAPSAGLYPGQTDEKEMGVTYAEITAYIKGLPVPVDKKAIMDAMSSRSAHKRVPPLRYEG